jgi:hypothetical protein
MILLRMLRVVASLWLYFFSGPQIPAPSSSDWRAPMSMRIGNARDSRCRELRVAQRAWTRKLRFSAR